MAPVVEVEHLVKRYKRAERNAVDDISFTVEDGAFFALLGPNGAGKTTALSILTTTLVPTSGRVQIAGYDVATQSTEVRREVGIIFQKPSLDQNLTAEENIRFHAILYRLYPFRPGFRLMPRAYRQQVRELADLLGIGDELFKPVKTYSGGMKRKLEIVRSLLHHPRVLFLDEPTTGLDPISRRNLWDYLHQMRRQYGATVVLTTHYLEEAEQADQVCILNSGRILSEGTPQEVKTRLLGEYLLIDADDREGLRAELTSQRIPYAEAPPFKIPLAGLNTHRLLRDITTPLTLVRTVTPTLEDAYIELIHEQEHVPQREDVPVR